MQITEAQSYDHTGMQMLGRGGVPIDSIDAWEETDRSISRFGVGKRGIDFLDDHKEARVDVSRLVEVIDFGVSRLCTRLDVSRYG